MQQQTSPRCAVPAPSQQLPYHMIQTDNLGRVEAGISVGRRRVDHWVEQLIMPSHAFLDRGSMRWPRWGGRIGAACCFDILAVILEKFKRGSNDCRKLDRRCSSRCSDLPAGRFPKHQSSPRCRVQLHHARRPRTPVTTQFCSISRLLTTLENCVIAAGLQAAYSMQRTLHALSTPSTFNSKALRQQLWSCKTRTSSDCASRLVDHAYGAHGRPDFASVVGEMGLGKLALIAAFRDTILFDVYAIEIAHHS